MKKKTRLYCILTLYFFLTNCANLVDKGDKLFEAGMYREAADFYQQALTKDKTNVKAKIGLNHARFKIIDSELIEVRKLRLSSSMSLATQKLEQIYRNEKLWNIEPTGAITATQAEETHHAKKWLLSEAKELSLSKYPDKFRWFEYTYKELIANGQLTNTLKAYHEPVWKKGVNLCNTVAKNIEKQRYFLKSYTEKYCASWGQQIQPQVDNVDTSRFSSLDTSFTMDHNLPHEHNQQANIHSHINALKEQFQQNIWHSPLSKTSLALKINNKLSYQKSIRPIIRKAAYTTKKTVTNTDSHGKETSETVTLKHQHRYKVQTYSETLMIDINYSSYILNQAVSRHINKKELNTSESHNETFRDANLYPRREKLMDIDQKLSQHLKTLNNDYFLALNQRWIKEYCDRHISEISGENVMRCAKLRPKNTYVNRWFSQKFGLNYEQMAQLHGIQ